MAEYAIITAFVASLALALGSIPSAELQARLPTTAAKARVLVAATARQQGVSPAEARAALARAPYRRAALRYLYASCWIDGRRNAATCVFAKVTPDPGRARLAEGIRKDARLRGRLSRIGVTVAQAAEAVTRGSASAC